MRKYAEAARSGRRIGTGAAGAAVPRARWMELACGLASFILVWWLWGSLRAVAVNHDEAAFLLQAQIFASAKLVAPSPPLPDFFQQWHVLVRPVLASKYPPGYSLILVPGVWLGMPGLMPALMASIGAALVFAIARDLTNTRVALLAVVLSATSPITLRFSASYFSEVADAFLWLCAWFALHRHWKSGRRRWLLILAFVVGWGGITRPLSMLAFALPAGVAALFSIRRHRAWHDVPAALATAIAVTAIFPYWNGKVTGNWTKSAYAEYARQYIPADRIGFGVDTEAPKDSSSADVLAFDRAVRAGHRDHILANLPRIAAARAGAILQASWAIGAFAVVLILPASVVIPVGVMRLLLGTLVVSFGAYLLYAHPPAWTLYYLEFQAPLAFLTASGVYGLAEYASRIGAQTHRAPLASARHLRSAVLVLCSAALIVPALSHVPAYRAQNAAQRVWYEQFERAVRALPDGRSIVFVRHAPVHDVNFSVVRNVPDRDRAAAWIVHDRGAEDTSLVKFGGDRAPYWYHEWRLGGRTYWRIDPMDIGAIVSRTVP